MVDHVFVLRWSRMVRVTRAIATTALASMAYNANRLAGSAVELRPLEPAVAESGRNPVLLTLQAHWQRNEPGDPAFKAVEPPEF